MSTSLRSLAAAALAVAFAVMHLSPASAGTFKHITIDGSFSDWAGVPVAATDDEGDMMAGTRAGFDLHEIYVANDDQYLYLRVVLYPSSTNTDYSQFHHHFYFDSDNDPATGFKTYGLGSEMLIEDGGGYSERYGRFNDGDMTGLDWDSSPTGMLPTLQYEARFSRAVRDVQPADVPSGSGNPARNLPLFTQDAISIAFEVEDSNWAISDGGTAFTYEMAPKPPPFTGTKTLVGLTGSNWRANDAGSDLGVEWLSATYDDSQAGWKSGTGLFGFNAPSGYPAPVNTILASGPSAYYLRTHFSWDNDQNGAGLVLSNYLSAGAVFYLNGAEVLRLRMPAGPVTYATPATGGPAQPGTAETFDLPALALVVGDNLLEVEVHPASGAVSSLVFGASLTASDSFPPRIQDPTQPADRNVVEGQATSFSPGALAGTQPFTYQWFKDGTPIPGATNAVLTLDPVTASDAGQYSVEIANAKGSKVSSRAAVLATTAVAVALTDPNLPADQTVTEGNSVTFTVAATGSLLSYQWYREGEAIAGETGTQLTLTNVPFGESGKRYWVVVSNRLNNVTSRQATLTVTHDSTAPVITAAIGGGRAVTITFSEGLDAASAQQASNYTLDGGVQVQSAVLSPTDGHTVSLTTAPQGFGQVYKLSVTGVKDLFGNVANASISYRSSILIDGGFEDWANVPVGLSQDQQNPGTIEFKEFSITNDNDYLYFRFSFFAPAGPLGPDTFANHYDIVIDTDQDPATGTWSGGDVLIEDGGVYRLAGSWTQGTYTGTDVAVSPGETKTNEFELRISRRATHQDDGLPAFPNPAVDAFIVIQSGGWGALDQTSPAITYTFFDFPPLQTNPVSITAKRAGSKIELTWPGSGVLQTRPSLTTGTWTPVPGAVSGIQIDPSTANSGFYRLSQ